MLSYLRFLFILVFIVLNSNLINGQDKSTEICLNYTFDEDRNYEGFSLQSDTLNQYVLLGDFRNDSVTFYINDSIIYNKLVHVDYKYGYSDIIKIPSTGKLSFKINNMSVTRLERLDGKNYITIFNIPSDKRLDICYSKYCPMIY